MSIQLLRKRERKREREREKAHSQTQHMFGPAAALSEFVAPSVGRELKTGEYAWGLEITISARNA